MLRRKFWFLFGLLFMGLLAACSSNQSSQVIYEQPITSDSVSISQHPTPTPTISIPQQVASPSVGAHNGTSDGSTPTTVSGPAPYGPPPAMTTEETQLTQQLFNLINQDRAARGLYPFTWNAKLAAGARLHSWNMYHCGFSHTCPDGVGQCTRIANEGFTFSDCGECIGLAGPSNPPWTHVYQVQESMINEPPTGWHRIHLTSTTLHQIGVGMYVDPTGWIWFTEDIIS
ncbi:MAG TPA: CAP domain-containing protein [Ktedonobacteraceae bacterium]|nr:CAP domain-containing protein [Ktedonobacteraceae bacterium]